MLYGGASHQAERAVDAVLPPRSSRAPCAAPGAPPAGPHIARHTPGRQRRRCGHANCTELLQTGLASTVRRRSDRVCGVRLHQCAGLGKAPGATGPVATTWWPCGCSTRWSWSCPTWALITHARRRKRRAACRWTPHDAALSPPLCPAWRPQREADTAQRRWRAPGADTLELCTDDDLVPTPCCASWTCASCRVRAHPRCGGPQPAIPTCALRHLRSPHHGFSLAHNCSGCCWLLPLLVLLYLVVAAPAQEETGAELFQPVTWCKRGPGPRRQRLRRHIPPALFLLALALPCWWRQSRPLAVITLPSQDKETIMLAMDVSGSMRAADVEPDRITAAQNAAKAFIAELAPPCARGHRGLCGHVPSWRRLPTLKAAKTWLQGHRQASSCSAAQPQATESCVSLADHLFPDARHRPVRS